LLLRSRLSVEKPGAAQQIAELLLTNPLGFGIKDLLEENVHHGALKLIPFVGSISGFRSLSNLLSVIPVFAARTADKSVPLACAILTFCTQLAGSPPSRCWPLLAYVCWLAQEVGRLAVGHSAFSCRLVSTSARILSLTVRLWANIVASDLLYTIFLGLFSMATVAALVQIGGLRRCNRCVAGHHSHRLYRAAYLRGHHSGLHFHGSALGLPGMATATSISPDLPVNLFRRCAASV